MNDYGITIISAYSPVSIAIFKSLSMAGYAVW
jgi:hypothetical protein